MSTDTDKLSACEGAFEQAYPSLPLHTGYYATLLRGIWHRAWDAAITHAEESQHVNQLAQPTISALVETWLRYSASSPEEYDNFRSFIEWAQQQQASAQ